jgi:hypothetical protein
METKIQLSHPAGKKAVRMDKDKYDILRKAIFRCLKNKTLTHTELFKAVITDFKKNKIKFIGSIEWYMESVKLDLEANKLIHRHKDKSQLKFKITTSSSS